MKTFALLGQSNLSNWWANVATPPAVDSRVTMLAGTSWVAPVGDALITFGNNLASFLADTIRLLPCAVPGSSIETWQNESASNLSAFLAACDAVSAVPDYIVFGHGESYASSGDEQAYYDALAEMHHAILKHFGKKAHEIPIIVGVVGNYPGFPLVSNVRRAQIEFGLNHPGALLGPCHYDLPMADSPHLATQSYVSMALRYAKCILYARGLVSASGCGPRLLSATRHGTTVYLKVQRNGDRGLYQANSMNLTGFEVSENGFDSLVAPTLIRVHDDDTIILKLPRRAPVSIRYMWGDNPNRANMVSDNGNPFLTPSGPWDSYGLPLLPTSFPIATN